MTTWKPTHPSLTPVYERLGLFDVYSSVWFSAIYILLMVSLVGCVVPRLRVYWRAMRARPPRVPRRLGRLPESRRFELDEDARGGAGAGPRRAAPAALPGGRGRTVRCPRRRATCARPATCSSTSRCWWCWSASRFGQLYGYKGGVITIVGQGFSNTLSQYDDFAPGTLFDPDDLAPLSFTVDDFHVKWLTSGPEMGQPRSFDAGITYRDRAGAPAERSHDLAVNHPLSADGANVFLVGHGYAPVVTVRGGDGGSAYSGPVVFLPQDSSFASFGVIKVPDAGPEQLGFEGLFLPTYGFTMARGPYSQFPDTLDPVLSLVPYHGDLGMDGGAAAVGLRPRQGRPAHLPQHGPRRLGPDRRIKLDGRSDGPAARRHRVDPLRRGAALGQAAGQPQPRQGHRARRGVARDPRPDGLAVHPAAPGLGAGRALPTATGPRTGPDDGPRRTVVELAGLDRSSGGDLGDEVDELERLVRGAAPPSAPTQPRQHPQHRREGARVSTADFAAFSNNAIMFASIVYVLAFLAHLVEWVLVRSLPRAPTRRGPPGRQRGRGRLAARGHRRRARRPGGRRARSSGSRSAAGSGSR